MPKLTGPLFSVEAHKALAKALTYQRRPGGASVYGYKKPKVPLTIPQLLQRWDIASAVVYGHLLTTEQKAEWNAKAKGQGQSGYSYMVSHYCHLNYDRPLWLPMQEGSGNTVYDRSGHGNNGTITGATWTRLPSGLWCLSFGGDDDLVTVANAPSLVSNNFSVELWFNPDNVTAVLAQLAGWRKGSEWYTLACYANWAALSFIVDEASYANELVTSNVLTAGAWHHVVFSYFDPTREISVNGILKATDETAGKDANSTYPLIMGRWAGGAGQWLAGKEALVRVHVPALSAGEPLRHYNREKNVFGM